MHIADRLALPGGYLARPYRGRDDHADIARILGAARAAKGDPQQPTVGQIDATYAHLADCDPDRDIFVVERAGGAIAYGRSSYSDLETGVRDLVVFAPTLPEHDERPLFEALVTGAEAHMTSLARDVGRARFRAYAGHPGPGRPAARQAAWLEDLGYVATEWGAKLVKPDLDDADRWAAAPLPDGVEVRPVTADQIDQIITAHLEAFRGEWDFHEPTPADRSFFVDDPLRDESLWQVAWAGDTVVGQVKPFVNPDENAELDRRRANTEHISVHHDWRNRGIAGALLGRALLAVRERGMQEAALGVDTENPGGAFALYTKLGFEPAGYEAVYTKPTGRAAPAASAREATIADADAIAAAHTRAWEIGYRGRIPDRVLDDPRLAKARRERWRARLAEGPPVGGDPDDRVFAAVLDEGGAERVVGFGHAGREARPPDGRDPDGEIYGFYVHPRAWSTGAATRLMDACLDELRRRGFRRAVLWVMADNPRARRFYERAGWELSDVPPDLCSVSAMVGVADIADDVPEVQYAIDL